MLYWKQKYSIQTKLIKSKLIQPILKGKAANVNICEAGTTIFIYKVTKVVKKQTCVKVY